MRRRKKSLIGIVILIVLFLGIGYAYLTTTLSINGTTDVDANTWNVYWNNVQVSDGSVTGSQVTQAPTIDTNKTTVSFQVRLSKPGDYYEFTVDAVNAGTLDAMIENINKTTNIPNYLNYMVTYDDGITIKQNQLLNSNSLETYKVRVEYKTDIDASDLPVAAQTLSLTFGLSYIQADNNALKVRNYVYAFNSTRTYIGDPVSRLGITYETPRDLYNSIRFGYFSRHIVEDDKIVSSDIGFMINNWSTYTYYYIKSGVSEEVYEKNVQTLRDAFDESRCSFSDTESSCSNGNISVVVKRSGYNSIIGGCTCNLYSDGSTRCYED